MQTDPDVTLAREKWRSGEWTAFDVLGSLVAQWSDRHPDMGDTDNDGVDDDAEVNAHSPEAAALFLEALADVLTKVASFGAAFKRAFP